MARARVPIHAKVLNRNVAVISSYEQVQQCLCDQAISASLSAGLAYDELIAPFFPMPNLLLMDPPHHAATKQEWTVRMDDLLMKVRPQMRTVISAHFDTIPSGSNLDLYESMKGLAWKVLSMIFLSYEEAEAEDVRKTQDELMHGQFSLFPVSINTRIWKSPRSRGIEASKKLRASFASKFARDPTKCPFTAQSEAKEDISNHLTLFTSSLATKAMASLLTAFLLNLYLLDVGTAQEKSSIASRICLVEDRSHRENMLRQIFDETERLSPPVVGIMRRATSQIILGPPPGAGSTSAPTLIPKDWDVWLYFVGAARDPIILGPHAEQFQLPDLIDSQTHTEERSKGFAFGAGPKTCLGRDSARAIALTVAEVCLGPREKPSLVLERTQEHIPRGVQGWLGWIGDIKPEEWAQDMKQLPTQRPVKPLMVTLGLERTATK